MTEDEGATPVETSGLQNTAVTTFYNLAFEDGRKKGFDEGVRAAQVYLANMPTSEVMPSKPLTTPIEDLDFSVRTYNCLKREDAHTIGDVVKYSEFTLYDIRNFGRKSIDEVKDKLSRLGYYLAPSPPGFELQ